MIMLILIALVLFIFTAPIAVVGILSLLTLIYNVIENNEDTQQKGKNITETGI